MIKHSAKEMRETSSMRRKDRRDASEERTRMRGLPDPDRSEREGAGPVRTGMGSEESFFKRGVPRNRSESRASEQAKSIPEKESPGRVRTGGE